MGEIYKKTKDKLEELFFSSNQKEKRPRYLLKKKIDFIWKEPRRGTFFNLIKGEK